MNDRDPIPMIEIRGLEKTYRAGKVDVPALNRISLSVQRGEFVSLVGPSGCGKSTLLYAITGLASPTGGSVRIEGMEITGLPDTEISRIRGRKIGFVFQRFNLLPAMSVIENLEFARRIRRLPKGSGYGIREILDIVRISDKGHRRPAELSVGEQQRVAVARAVVHRPAILLADEPTGNLDSENSAAIVRLFSRMNRELGQTVLLVTHNSEVAGAADRIVRMKDGKIV